MRLRRTAIGVGFPLVAAFALAPAAQAKSASGFDEPQFEAALEKAKAGDSAVDFKWLRQQNAMRLGYGESEWTEARKTFEALDEDPGKALRLARKRLDDNYFDLFAHFAVERALSNLGQADESAAEHAILMAILASIIDGKSGQSAGQAFNATSVGEEYQLLGLLNLKPENQALDNEGGHAYDVMKVIDGKSGKELSIWFEIDSFFGKAFEGALLGSGEQ